MYNHILVNCDELWLKGKNRPYYFSTLKEHITLVVAKIHPSDFDIKNEQQRFVLSSKVPFTDRILSALSLIPGIHSILPCLRVEPEIKDMIEGSIAQLIEGISFRITCKRVDKNFPLSSMDICTQVGQGVVDHFSSEKISVDLKNPDIVVDIKLLPRGAFISKEKIFAAGGLPVGTSGHVISLLSGGFDSPVASFMMSKRGCSQTAMFFHAYPFVGDEVKNKVVALAKVLARYQRKLRLYIVPFGEMQKQIAKLCREDYRTLFFRRYMVEVANLLAEEVGAEGIVTGDSLSQVSSQTLSNITLIDQVGKLPVIRPLIGMNKQEIIALAQEIGTHHISTLPHDDACVLFASKHPVTRGDASYWNSFATRTDFTALCMDSLARAQVLEFFPTDSLVAPSCLSDFEGELKYH